MYEIRNGDIVQKEDMWLTTQHSKKIWKLDRQLVEIETEKVIGNL